MILCRNPVSWKTIEGLCVERNKNKRSKIVHTVLDVNYSSMMLISKSNFAYNYSGFVKFGKHQIIKMKEIFNVTNLQINCGWKSYFTRMCTYTVIFYFLSLYYSLWSYWLFWCQYFPKGNQRTVADPCHDKTEKLKSKFMKLTLQIQRASKVIILLLQIAGLQMWIMKWKDAVKLTQFTREERKSKPFRTCKLQMKHSIFR